MDFLPYHNHTPHTEVQMSMRNWHALPTPSNTSIIVIAHKRLEVNHSIEKMKEGIRAYYKGALMQKAFAFLSAEEREFLMTGFTPDEQKEIFDER